ncbi:RNA-binding protein [Rhizobium sp. Root482]|uniref:RNA-binding protein n=1 Tax=Rhizobium sp. Root482 TaxID=1736543 RepID=UPI0006FDDB5C|nr:RNA-binding protein [Rhizobium sp. Root482]KQY13142.1 DNA-binding protein [Rhizobium sp. Root482]
MLVEDRDPVADVEGEAVNGRMCIVTRQGGTPETLIRFVAGPEGRVVADLKKQLPGRGCWVSAERSVLEKAIARKLFNRALRADVTAGPELADEVDRLLVLQLAGMMNLARKAAQFVSGASKVEQAVRGLAALATFHAVDAAADGVRKIDQARKAMSFVVEDGQEIPSYRFFTEAEMEGLLGQNAFIHACALAGQAGEGVVKRANMLERYRGTVPARAVGADTGQPTQ